MAAETSRVRVVERSFSSAKQQLSNADTSGCCFWQKAKIGVEKSQKLQGVARRTLSHAGMNLTASLVESAPGGS
jgi:hypothetical protein